jgi:dihydrofolate synthase / folylpolyglutamate synthase
MSAPLAAGAAPAAGAFLDAWLDWQTRLHPRSIELGLSRVGAVADRLGLRPARMPTLTIGGTNGKGAATTLAALALREAGYRVGAYTSPHLQHYRERVAINGTPVEDAQLVAAFEAIEAVRGDTPLTYFEFGTLAALWCFAAARCEVQVLEVGLGGRLDAVNLLDADGALITSIGLDHRDWLGDTRESVAREKGGIFRPGRPAVCTDTDPPAAWPAALAAAGIHPLWLGDGIDLAPGEGGWTLRNRPQPQARHYPDAPALPGEHQRRNAAGVFTLLDALAPRLAVPEAARQRALAAWRLPGRCERWGEVLLDVAHNTEAVEALVPVLARLPRPRHLLLGMLDDKPVETVTARMAPLIDAAELLSLSPPRGLSAAALAALCAPELRIRGQHETAAAALAAARRGAASVVVCGSFLTVAAVREVLARG